MRFLAGADELGADEQTRAPGRHQSESTADWAVNQ